MSVCNACHGVGLFDYGEGQVTCLNCDGSGKPRERSELDSLREQLAAANQSTKLAEEKIKDGARLILQAADVLGECLSLRARAELSEQKLAEVEKDAEIGRQWHLDSSLEKWFPFTATEIASLRLENAALRKAVEEKDARIKALAPYRRGVVEQSTEF